MQDTSAQPSPDPGVALEPPGWTQAAGLMGWKGGPQGTLPPEGLPCQDRLLGGPGPGLLGPMSAHHPAPKLEAA